MHDKFRKDKYVLWMKNYKANPNKELGPYIRHKRKEYFKGICLPDIDAKEDNKIYIGDMVLKFIEEVR